MPSRRSVLGGLGAVAAVGGAGALDLATSGPTGECLDPKEDWNAVYEHIHQ